jgi:hypothetical protein
MLMEARAMVIGSQMRLARARPGDSAAAVLARGRFAVAARGDFGECFSSRSVHSVAAA